LFLRPIHHFGFFSNSMKTSWLIISLLVFAASRIQGQVSQSGPLASAGQGTIQVQDTPYAVVSKGANQQVWQKTTYETLPSGQTIPHIHKYTELATGLNHLVDGQWVASAEEIDILPNGTAAATNGQHQVYFPGDIYDGVIELLTPDGKHLRSRPLGLSYDDGSHTVLIAELKHSTGEMAGSNQVIYPDAFTDFKADIRYTYTKGRFEQDIILREQPLTPESYGLNPDTARLEALTEFFDPPQPTVKTRPLPEQAGVSLTDETLDFGNMEMIPGRAFLLGTNTDTGGIFVSKKWLLLDGRQFLMEEVPVEALVDKLVTLPVPQQASIKSGNKTAQKLRLPVQHLAKAKTKERILRAAKATTVGLVLDYAFLNTSQNNYTFQGDTTYYIYGNVNLNGTNTTFEGGSVLKYATNVTLTVNTPVTWLGDSYWPVLLLAMDDNSAGESINGSTGNPSNALYATTALYFNGAVADTNLVLQHLRVANALTAVAISGSSGHVLSHVQLINCGNGIAAINTDFNLRNALFVNVQTNFTGSSATGRVEHLTADTASWLNCDIGAGLYLTNCLLVAITNLGNYSAFQNVSIESSGNGVFQAAWMGYHYLITNSTNRNAGTMNINPDLARDLKKMTTYPPIGIYTNITTDTTLPPQAPRNTAVPDIGYHYDPLDYVWTNYIGGLTSQHVNVGATLILTNGVAVGFHALYIQGTLISQGTPVNLNQMVGYSSVQEGIQNTNNASSAMILSIIGSGSLRFTRITGLGFNDPAGYNDICISGSLTMMDCNLRNMAFYQGSWALGGLPDCDSMQQIPVLFKNNIFERCNLTMDSNSEYPSDPGVWEIDLPFSDYFYDNLFWRSSFSLTGGNLCSFADFDFAFYYNVFDNCGASASDYPDVDWNGGVNDTTGFSDFSVPTFAYATGPLGRWYQLSTDFLNGGGDTSTTASSLGLYHYTTQTNQAIEGNSIVDLGFAYVAVGSNGNPQDSNGDGIPDYLEDANGNGLVENGENPWMAPPMITLQPTNLIVIQGNNATFSVTVAIQPPGVTLSYQWLQNGFPLSNDGNHVFGSTTSVLTLIGVLDTDSTFYQVVVSNPAGSVASSLATLTVLDPPVITTQPQNLTVNAGQNATFSLVAVGAVPMSYQWYSNSVVLANQTNTTFIFNSAQTNNAGTNFYVIVTNVAGSATSSVASLTVLLPPVLTIISGNNQSGPLNAFLPVPLIVQVTSSGGVPLTNAPITFSVTNGLNQLATSTNGGTLSASISLLTGINGYATNWLFLPSDAPPVNNVIVTAQSGTSSNQIVFTCFVAPLVITPNGGTFATMQNVTVSCTTTGAVMRYTLNGNVPTEADPIATNGQVIVILGSSTLSVDAFEDNVLLPSTVQTAVFTITGAISAGNYHTLALKYDRSVWAAGTNSSGQLGDGTTNNRPSLVSVTNLIGAIAISGGGSNSLALMTNGIVRAWGANGYGQLGDGTTIQRTTNVVVTNLTSVIAIAAGGAHGLALSNGMVRAWGTNCYGQLGDGTMLRRLTNVLVTNLTSVVAISAGGAHSLALLTNGTVRAWGTNACGQLGDGTTTLRTTNVVVTNLTSVMAIAAGGTHSLALLSNGTVRAWGANGYGQLGDGTTIQRTTNVVVTNLTSVMAIAAGGAHSLALLSNGTVRAWGTNNFGQLGDGTTNKSRLTNVLVINLSNVVAIAAGSMHSVALKSDGTVWVWGLTNYGLPGGFTNTPVLVQPTNHLIYWAAPTIVTQPQSQTNVVGQSATFSVVAAGTQPLSYQWYSNKLGVASATSASLTLNNVSTNASGSFSVVITNFLGSVTSTVATLTVNLPSTVTIISQPTNLTVAAGSTATFSVVAVDTNQPLYYQWFNNVVNGAIANATNATLTLSNVQTNQAGQYWVGVQSSPSDSANSAYATLTVIVPPSINTQPTNQTVPLGNVATFNVSVSGATPLIYQWLFGSMPINGATNTTLLLNNIQSSNLGGYCVVVTNIIGSITSSVVTLATNLPVPVAPPAGLTNWWPAEGNANDIISGMNGTLYGNGVSYAAGKVGQAFHFNGSYGLVSFGNTAGNFGTNDFTIEFWLRTTAGPFGEYPVIEKLPACGSTNEFTIRLEGQGFNNPEPGTLMADLGQSTNSRVSIQSTRTVNDGLFHHVALVRQATNLLLYIDGTFEVGGSTTNVVNINNPANLTAASGPCIGADNNYSSYFTGDLDELSIYNRGLLPSEIQAIYSAAGAGKSTTAPYIITQPASQQTFISSNVTFSVTAGGNVPFSYQWYGFNSGLLANATNATLSLNNLKINQTDNYFVVVSNTVGSTASAAATLTVLDPAIYDINGLPIAWELQYFGQKGVNPNADPDGDGWSNWQEYLNGTNPTNADQPFLILITQLWTGSNIP
jgi:alpha-tubulin suppressor-like RCC1 family protein